MTVESKKVSYPIDAVLIGGQVATIEIKKGLAADLSSSTLSGTMIFPAAPTDRAQHIIHAPPFKAIRLVPGTGDPLVSIQEAQHYHRMMRSVRTKMLGLPAPKFEEGTSLVTKYDEDFELISRPPGSEAFKVEFKIKLSTLGQHTLFESEGWSFDQVTRLSLTVPASTELLWNSTDVVDSQVGAVLQQGVNVSLSNLRLDLTLLDAEARDVAVDEARLIRQIPYLLDDHRDLTISNPYTDVIALPDWLTSKEIYWTLSGDRRPWRLHDYRNKQPIDPSTVEIKAFYERIKVHRTSLEVECKTASLRTVATIEKGGYHHDRFVNEVLDGHYVISSHLNCTEPLTLHIYILCETNAT